MWSIITIERSDAFEMTQEGEGAEDIPCDETNLVCDTCSHNWLHVKVHPPFNHTDTFLAYHPLFHVERVQVVTGMKAAFAAAGKPLPPCKCVTFRFVLYS
jgi:hypothetical protein